MYRLGIVNLLKLTVCFFIAQLVSEKLIAQQCNATISSGFTASPTKCIEDAVVDIQFTTVRATGVGLATGLPAGVTATWLNNTITIVGTASSAGQFNYSIPLIGSGCSSKFATGNITIQANNTVGRASNYPMLTLNNSVSPITHITNGATSIGTAVGLPNGLTASWQNNTITITGTPLQLGVFNYEIPLLGGCGQVSAKETISSYPVWRGGGSDEWGNSYNWSPAIVPASGATIVLDRYAANKLSLDINRTVGDIYFNAADKLIVLGCNNLTIAGNVIGANSINYIKTNTGVVKHNLFSDSVFVFPVGNSSYNPVSIKNRTGQQDMFSVKVYDEVYSSGSSTGTAISLPRVKRTWDIGKATANSGSGVDLKFYWNVNEEINLVSPTLLHYQNGAWLTQSIPSNLTYDTINRTLAYINYTGGFSTFAVGHANGTLPVKWVSFSANRQHESIILNWVTSEELNNSHFEIECSEEGFSFSKIARVDAVASASNFNSYSFVDSNPPFSNAYYRIKQVDKDGAYSFSSIISVDANNLEKYRAWTNPSLGILYLQVPQSLQGASLLQVYDASGKLVLNRQVLPGKNEINFRPVGGGYYFLQVLKSGKKVYSAGFISIGK
jgi:hypothetical protein